MTLKTKLGKADYDALDESLKSLYVADGENFKLDADYEDVDGLKAKRDELLGKVTEYQKTLKAFEGLDPDKAKEAINKLAKSEDDDLLNKRKFDELIEKKTKEWEAKEKGYLDKIATKTQREAEQQLTIKLAEAGVKGNRAEDLALVLTHKHIKFVEDGDGIAWKTLDGLETVDLDKFIPGLKESKADYFDSKLAPGAGTTPGSKETKGNGKSLTRDAFFALPPADQMAFSKEGGTVTD